MVCFLSCSSCSLVSLALAAAEPWGREEVVRGEEERREARDEGGGGGWEARDRDTSLDRERLSAWRRLSGTALVWGRRHTHKHVISRTNLNYLYY